MSTRCVTLFAKYAPKAINVTVIGLDYLAFFAANSMVGKIGSFLETWRMTNFWLRGSLDGLSRRSAFRVVRL